MPTSTVKTRFPGVYAREGKRRHNGKPDVCFYVTISNQGKKTWLKAGWKSEGMTAAAAAEMRAMRQAEARNTPGLDLRKSRQLTFDAAAEWYEAHHLSTLRGAQTAKSIIKTWLTPTFKGKPLARIDAAAVTALRDKAIAEGKSASIISLIISTLSGIFRFTEQAGMHSLDNPCSKVKTPSTADDKRIRFLSREEASALLSELAKTSPIWHDIAALSLWTGARRGELLSLHAQDVDLINGIAYVTGKTGRRVIHLNAAARELLARRIEAHKGAIFPAGTSVSKNDHISHCTKAFSHAVAAIGLNPPGTPRSRMVVFHTLRHTFASWLAIAGVPLYTISQLMGHSSVNMTQRYAHLCPDAKQDAVELLSSAFDAGEVSPHNSPSSGCARSIARCPADGKKRHDLP